MSKSKPRRKREVRGYIAVSRDKSRAIVCLFDVDSKRYLWAELSEAQEALTGKRAYAKIYGFK